MYHKNKTFLFAERRLGEFIEEKNGSIFSRVDNIPRDQLLNTPEEIIIDNIYSTLVIEPLELYVDKKTMDRSETGVDISYIKSRNPFNRPGPIYVKGIKVIVSIPFTGDADLWHFKPTNSILAFPNGYITLPNRECIGCLNILVEQPLDEDPNKIKSIIDDQINLIMSLVNYQRIEIEKFNDGLKLIIKQSIENKKHLIKKYDFITESIGIPLKKKNGVPEFKPITINRKIVKPLPPVPKSGYIPEPGISQSDYEQIIKLIRHVGRTFETTPKTYAIHEEEELRDIILANLNGFFEGKATGETFRKNGKTDIRIEDDKRAAFVGECKIWRGQKELLGAVDQLLGYLTWRDCKTALIIFNKKNSKVSDLLKNIPQIISKHPKTVKDLPTNEHGEWRFLFSAADDDSKHIYIHFMLFDLHLE